MKLPEDLIKATDYSKAKDREIKEFEYVNGKYIHHYVLGGEHELKPQEIVDCLNAIATIDCDLQTAYAYIQGQKDKVADLEAKLEESEEILNWQNEIIEGVKQEEELLAQKLKSLGVDCIEDLGKETNQDKISFALEQLEKVKEFLAKRKEDYLYLKDEIKAISHNQYVDFMSEVEVFELKVDNQIKAIKNQKE